MVRCPHHNAACRDPLSPAATGADTWARTREVRALALSILVDEGAEVCRVRTQATVRTTLWLGRRLQQEGRPCLLKVCRRGHLRQGGARWQRRGRHQAGRGTAKTDLRGLAAMKDRTDSGPSCHIRPARLQHERWLLDRVSHTSRKSFPRSSELLERGRFHPQSMAWLLLNALNKTDWCNYQEF